MRWKAIIIIFIFSIQYTFTQVYKYSGEFLNIGIGAKSMALANSVVALTDDINSGYWNPSGLVNLPRDYEVGFMHAEYFAGIAKFDYISGAKKIDDRTTIGISTIRLGVDDIPNTLDLIDNNGNISYDRIKSFSVADYAFIGSYARKSNIEGLNYGANVKIIYRKTGEFANAWGFGLDAASQYAHNKWKFGAMAKDVTSTFTAWSFNTESLTDVYLLTGNDLPSNSIEITLPQLILGAARIFEINEKFSGITETDLGFTFDGKKSVIISSDFVSIDPRIGVELNYIKMIFLRLGVGNIQKVPNFDNSDALSFQPNFGLGIHYKKFSLDYALTDITNQSNALYSNIFTLNYSFNYTKSDE